MVAAKMGSAQKASKLPTRRDRIQKVMPMLAGVTAAYTMMSMPRLSSKPQPVHDSAFTGQMWVDELVQGMYSFFLLYQV